MNIAYVRVSTKEQNTGRKSEALKRHDIKKVFDANRPEVQAMLFANQFEKSIGNTVPS